MSDAANEPIETLRPRQARLHLLQASRFLRAIAEGKLIGQRCPVDGRVAFPTRGCGALMNPKRS